MTLRSVGFLAMSRRSYSVSSVSRRNPASTRQPFKEACQSPPAHLIRVAQLIEMSLPSAIPFISRHEDRLRPSFRDRQLSRHRRRSAIGGLCAAGDPRDGLGDSVSATSPSVVQSGRIHGHGSEDALSRLWGAVQRSEVGELGDVRRNMQPKCRDLQGTSQACNGRSDRTSAGSP
jgi:hypothetical protein